MTSKTLLTGPLLRYAGDPFRAPWQEVIGIDTDGAVLLQDGHITSLGTRRQNTSSTATAT